MDTPDKTPSTDVKPTSPSTETPVVSSTSDKSTQSLGSYIKEELASLGETEQTPASEVEKTDTDQENESDASLPEQEVESSDETQPEPPAETPVEENKPIPYKRFAEVNSKFREAEAKLAQHEKTLSDPDVRAAIDVLNLIRSNPARALEQLEPLVQQLKQIKGEAFPSDIADMLNEGTITKEVAVELTKLRHQSSATTRALENEKTSREQQHRNSIVQTWATWDSEHRKIDPDFQPGSKKWELVNKLLDSEVRKNGFPTEQGEAIKLVEGIYADVNALVSSAVPKKPTRRVLTSTTSSAGSSNIDPSKMSLLQYVKASL